jgi:hypothetical protein
MQENMFLPENTTRHPQGQDIPQTPCKAFRQSEFVRFAPVSFGRFRSACPRNSAQASLRVSPAIE